MARPSGRRPCVYLSHTAVPERRGHAPLAGGLQQCDRTTRYRRAYCVSKVCTIFNLMPLHTSPTMCDRTAIVPVFPRSEPHRAGHLVLPRSPPIGTQKNWASQRKPSAYPILRMTEHMKTSIGRTFVSRSPLLSFPYVSNKPSA